MTATSRWPRSTAERTQPMDPEVADSWRQGPRWFWVVALVLESTDVEDRRRAVAERVGNWLVPSAPGQAHVTLLPLGFGEPASDDLADSALPDNFAAARAGLPTDIEVTVGGADSYRSAVFLQVTARDASALRQRLAARLAPILRDGSWSGAGWSGARGSGFHPHVTVGTYCREVAMKDVAARLSELRELRELRTDGRLRLVAVDARDRFGGLREV